MAPAQLTVRVQDWNRAEQDSLLIRRQVFIEEQGIAASIEIDGRDPLCRHALAWADDQIVATGRLLPDAHIGRVAVLPAWRAQGVGRQIMQALIADARKSGHKAVHLSSQISAVDFYLKLGFEAEGPVFIEADIPHQAMSLRLS